MSKLEEKNNPKNRFEWERPQLTRHILLDQQRVADRRVLRVVQDRMRNFLCLLVVITTVRANEGCK